MYTQHSAFTIYNLPRVLLQCVMPPEFEREPVSLILLRHLGERVQIICHLMPVENS